MTSRTQAVLIFAGGASVFAILALVGMAVDQMYAAGWL
jgi:hypothetical protein